MARTRTRTKHASAAGAHHTEASPVLGLRERHKADKRARIRDAAWALFCEQGFEATTTRAIAERADVAAGTIFLYAKDKRDLLFLVFEDRLRATTEEAFATLPGRATLRTQLLHVFGRVFAMYGGGNEAVARHFVRELPGATGANADRVNELTMSFLARIGELVERAQARGEVRRSVVPAMAAHTIFAAYFMALFSWLSGFASTDAAFETMFGGSLDLLIRGLARTERRR